MLKYFIAVMAALAIQVSVSANDTLTFYNFKSEQLVDVDVASLTEGLARELLPQIDSVQQVFTFYLQNGHSIADALLQSYQMVLDTLQEQISTTTQPSTPLQ